MESERFVVMGWLATAAMVSAAFFFGPKSSMYARSRARNGSSQLAGLRNLGRTCYLNTILQALAACPSFIDWLRERHDPNTATLSSSLLQLLSVINGVDKAAVTELTVEPTAIIAALKKLGYSFSSGEEDAHHLFLALLQSLEKEIISKPKFHKGSLSDILGENIEADSDLLSPSSSSSAQFNDDFGVRTPDYDDDDNHSNYSFGSFLPGGNSMMSPGPYFASNPTSLSTGNLMEGPRSLYSLKKRFARKRSFRYQSYRAKPLERIQAQLAHEHPFSGSLTSQLVCAECSRRSTVRYDKFDCISLAFPVRAAGLDSEYELERLLLDFVNPEVVTDVECEACSKKSASAVLTNHRKTLYLGKLPKCLCIHLSRNEWNLKTGKMIKRLEHVKFPATLSLHDYTYLENSRDEQAAAASASSWSNGGTSCDLKFGQLYQLVAVVVHTGTAESGHFMTYRRGTNKTVNNWYFTSDCEIRQVDAEAVYKSTAYMLFYEKLTFKNYMQFATGDNDDLFN